MSHDIKEDFWLALAQSPFLMIRLDASTDHALPMTAQLDDALGPARGGAIWFFTDRHNRLAPGGPAMAQFMSTGHDLFACLSGTLVEESDAAVIDRFWDSNVAAWYDQGRSDPALLMLRMDLDDIEIWKADMGIKGWLKLMTGKKLAPEDAGEHVQEPI